MEIMRAKIAKSDLVHGVRPVGRTFGVQESTVKGFIKSYKVKQNEVNREDIATVPKLKRGAKPLLSSRN